MNRKALIIAVLALIALIIRFGISFADEMDDYEEASDG